MKTHQFYSLFFILMSILFAIKCNGDNPSFIYIVLGSITFSISVINAFNAFDDEDK